MSRPRRLAWSFLWVRRCSVRPVMRSVSRAICTSGEPVSLGSRRYESMISVLRSFVIDIAVLVTSAADDSTALTTDFQIPTVFYEEGQASAREVDNFLG